MPTSKDDNSGPADMPFSQPQLTGSGKNVETQISIATTYLRTKHGYFKTISELIDYLGVHSALEEHKRQLAAGLKRHPRVLWQPDLLLSEQSWNSGKFTYSPIIPNVQDSTALLEYLQRKIDASGVLIKSLQDGWPECEDELARLANEHKIFIFPMEKGKRIWQDNPSLHYTVQPELSEMWHRIQLPSVDDIHGQLLSIGQKPTGEDPRKITDGKPTKLKVQKKQQTAIRNATNAHMDDIIQDYSDKRR